MAASCPIPTPEERFRGLVQSEAEAALLAKVRAALDEAAAGAAERLAAAGNAMAPPSRGYFTAVLHQHLYCVLCGADPETFAGGDPAVALGVIRNAENVARHHWGAAIPSGPSPAPPAGTPPPAR